MRPKPTKHAVAAVRQEPALRESASALRREIPDTNSTGAGGSDSQSQRKRIRVFGLWVATLILAFAKPLYELFRESLGSDVDSHVISIPLISAYLVWIRRGENARDLRSPGSPSLSLSTSPWLAMMALATGLVALNGWLRTTASSLQTPDHHALAMLSFLCLLLAGALLLLGARFLRAFAFPAAFLIFMIPLPSVLRNGIEMFLQHTSADAAAALFALSGSTVFRDGLLFYLPGITIQVSEECSGIRSSLVLLISSLVAGYMFLRSPWNRLILALCVVPLAILRNGLRIFTIALLCVHIDPSMIDSAIHRRGGPLFFAMSLIPLILLLVWLRRAERRREANSAIRSGCCESPHP